MPERIKTLQFTANTLGIAGERKTADFRLTWRMIPPGLFALDAMEAEGVVKNREREETFTGSDGAANFFVGQKGRAGKREPRLAKAANSPAAAASARQHFGKMYRLPVRELGDLLAATEAIGDENCGRWSGFNRGQQTLRGDGLRNFKLADFESEWTGHAAAAGLDQLHRRACLAQE